MRLCVCASVPLFFAACHDNVGTGSCLEPTGTAYAFGLGGDSTLIFNWPRARMPVRVYAEPAGDLRANVATGLALWQSAFRCGEFAYTMTEDSTRADIVVRNPPVLPAPTPAAVVAAADSVTACTGVTQGDTLAMRLTGPLRSYVAPRSFDTAAVASCYHFVTAHEIGHALGLFAHSPSQDDLMYGTPRRLALSDADRLTIQTLYHTRPTISPAPR